MLPKEPKEEEIDLDQIMEEASSAKARSSKAISTKAKSLDELRPETATTFIRYPLHHSPSLNHRCSSSNTYIASREDRAALLYRIS